MLFIQPGQTWCTQLECWRPFFLLLMPCITSHCKKEWRLQHQWRDRETLDGQNNHMKPTGTRYCWGYEQCLYSVFVCVCVCVLLLLIPWAMTQTGCKNKTDEYSWVALNPSDAPLYAVAMATTSGFCQFNTTWTKKYHFSLVWVLHLEILSLSLSFFLFCEKNKKRESDTRRGKKDLKMSSCS